MAKAKKADMITKMQEELVQLDAGDRARVIQGALDDITVIDPIDFCGIFVPQTGIDNDLQDIVDRVRVTAELDDVLGSVINVGETFTVRATVRNCSGWGLKNVRLSARNTIFASVTGASSVALGDLANRQTAPTAVFSCTANTETPVQDPDVADALINLDVNAVVDLESRSRTTRKAVRGEVKQG